MLVTEGRDLLRTLFETTSAFGTVGLSMGENGAPVSLSAFFSPIGKVLMIADDVHGPPGAADAGVRGGAPGADRSRSSGILKARC